MALLLGLDGLAPAVFATAEHRYRLSVDPLLRWVTVAPGGDRVLYQALGKLWVRDLPDGEPRRRTVAPGPAPVPGEKEPRAGRR